MWQDWRALGTSSSSSCTDFAGKRGGENPAEAKTPHKHAQTQATHKGVEAPGPARHPEEAEDAPQHRHGHQGHYQGKDITERTNTSTKASAFSHNLVSITQHGYF